MDFKIHKICIPFNFSENSTNALRMAIAVAVANKSSLHLLHVARSMTSSQFSNVRRKVTSMLRATFENVSKTIDFSGEDRITLRGLDIQFDVRMGTIGTCVGEFEQSENIDLTVIGTHGVRGLKELLIGTKSVEILNATMRTVMTVPANCKSASIQRVLFPIRNAVNAADKVDYLNVVFTNELQETHLLAVYDVNHEDEVFEVNNKLKEIRDRLKLADANVTFETLSSKSIPQTIVEVANKIQADLIVINATNDKEWFSFGTASGYTNQMINRSMFPILCIKKELVPENSNFTADEKKITLAFTG